MFIFGNILNGIAQVLDILLSVYMWVIIIRALLSWVNPDPYNPIVRILTRMTEPVLRPVRKLVPPHRLGLDFSPFIVILVIIFLRSALIQTLFRLARAFQ